MLLAAVLYFVFAGVGEEGSTPAAKAALQVQAGAKKRLIEPRDTASPDTLAAPGPPAATATNAPASIKAILAKKATLWIDGKPTLHDKNPISLPAGAHEVKVRFGKKEAAQTMDLTAGGEYELRFDAKSGQPQLKQVK